MVCQIIKLTEEQPFTRLSMAMIKQCVEEHQCITIEADPDYFEDGLTIDCWTAKLLSVAYDSMSDMGRRGVDHRAFKTPYDFIFFIEKCREALDKTANNYK